MKYMRKQQNDTRNELHAVVDIAKDSQYSSSQRSGRIKGMNAKTLKVFLTLSPSRKIAVLHG
jgi:ATP phosphoribosyltransferase regulatory subunit HisZ